MGHMVTTAARSSYLPSPVSEYVTLQAALASAFEAGGEAEGLEGGVMVAHVVHLKGGMGDTVFVG